MIDLQQREKYKQELLSTTIANRAQRFETFIQIENIEMDRST